MNNEIIEIERADFPDKLKNIKNAPKKLYAKGNINLLYEKNFVIVGTRRITEYGENNCKFFAKELALRDIPIVSGMALGTDSIAHKTCLENEGKTIAVMGSGFCNIFPKANLSLYQNIIDNDGLVITEFENQEKPVKENFPKRNRIVTAISEGILVIEAGYRSGTSITVKNAKMQGKKVFALPGKLDSCVGIGVNKMIKNGAILTTNIEDILEYYPDFNQRKRRNINRKINLNIKPEYIQIYNSLLDKEKNLDELVMQFNMNLRELLKLLTNMEIDGIIEKDLGIYRIVEKDNI